MTPGYGSRVIDTVSRELRYALRSLRKSWGFTVLAVASLGIGLGANTALFSLVDALLLRTLPVAEPERLVLVQRIGANGKAVPLDGASLRVIRELTPIYRDAALSAVLPSAGVTIDTQPEPARQAFTTSATFFQTLGIAAQAGRLHDSEPIAVISDRFWSARFSRNPDAIGRPLVVDGATYPIAGVAAPGFRGVSLDSAGDIWLVQPQFRGMATSAIARLTPEVTSDQAIAATGAALDNANISERGSDAGPILTSIVPGGQGTSTLREQYRVPLLALMGLVALVLLMTCANVANLLVVRNMNRAHELNVRTALGAGRWQLMRQLLIEGLVLAIMGAAVAWLCAGWCIGVLLSTVPSVEAASRLGLEWDLRVLTFMGVVALLTTVGFALLPAWRATRVNVSSSLRAAPSQGVPAGARRLGLVTVGVQVALCAILVAAASLFAQSVRNVATMPLGFERSSLIEVELADRVLRLSAAEVQHAHNSFLEGLGALPGVEEVALSLPLFPAWAVGIEKPEGESGMRVSVDYFPAMKIPLRRGRLLTPDDLLREDPVVVVNEGTRGARFLARTRSANAAASTTA